MTTRRSNSDESDVFQTPPDASSLPILLSVGEAGSINPASIILVAALTSAPVKRFLKYSNPGRIINLTYGYPQRSLVVFANGLVAITRYPPEVLTEAIRTGEEIDFNDSPL